MMSNIKLSTITPIFIGSNDFLFPLSDYFYLDNKLYYFSLDNLIQNIDNSKTEIFLQQYYNSLAVKDTDKHNLFNVLKSADIDPFTIVKYSVPCNTNPANRNIKKYISSSDKIFIPGSSIKGIIRTSILYDYLKNHELGQETLEVFLRKFRTTAHLFSARQKEISNLERIRKNEKSYKAKTNLKHRIDEIITPLKLRVNNIIKILEKDLFGTDPDSDFMKHVVVTDSNQIPRQQCLQIDEIRRIRFNDKKIIGGPIISELVKEKIYFNFEIKFDKTIKRIHNEEYFRQLNYKKILELADNFARDQISIEMNLYGKDKYFNNIVEFNKNMLKTDSKAYLIRIGGNKSFIFNTISNLFPKNEFLSLREILRIGENPFTGELVRSQFPSTQRFLVRNNEVRLVPGWCSINLE